MTGEPPGEEEDGEARTYFVRSSCTFSFGRNGFSTDSVVRETKKQNRKKN
jgi:hypothetical protein